MTQSLLPYQSSNGQAHLALESVVSSSEEFVDLEELTILSPSCTNAPALHNRAATTSTERCAIPVLEAGLES